MSILFYRRPDYTSPLHAPTKVSECQRYVERSMASAHAIPPRLSFDEVINNNPLPPCSLNDFMDYLIYVERGAENLQFYLWYLDYVRRWNELPFKHQAASPQWQQDLVDVQNLGKEKDGRSLRKPSFNPSERANFEDAISEGLERKGTKSDGYSTATLSPKISATNIQAGHKWQPYSTQPYHEECELILRHYIKQHSPRELNMSHKDRNNIFQAIQHTTHPSAFLPAFMIADATLRGQSHPNFIRWSICNGNKPRVIFVRGLGIQGVIVGFIIAIVLATSHVSRWYRIFAAIFWFIGFSTIIAAYKGLCLILHLGHSRNLRPWELSQDISVHSLEQQRRNSRTDSTNGDQIQLAERIVTSSDRDLKDDRESLSLERSSMNTFGSKNDLERERWAETYEKRSLIRKIFEKSVRTQDETLQVLQDRIVLGANIWGLVVTLPLTVLFVALPQWSYF